MLQFDPNIPGLMEGEVTGVAVIDPQPFKYGVGNHVVDPNKPFELKIEWTIFGQLVPLWLSALEGEWDVSVYAESLGKGPEKRLGTAKVKTTEAEELEDKTKPNLKKYTVTIKVPEKTLPPHDPGSDVGGIYKLVTAVFLNSKIAGVLGFDLVGYSEGPIIQVEEPH